jgi:oxygen-independent coproporphyrinogen-3 oxidase
LIYGLPGQTLAQWQADLVQALALGLQHISLYGLSVEADTPWGKMQAAGELVPIDDDLAADMFELALELLPAAGFCHYEISNFALDGYQSRHNLAYWQRHNYLGLGVAAAGCVLNHRIYNEKDPLAYSQRVSKGELPIAEEEFLTIDQVIAEAVFLGLRMREGIDFFAFRRQYGIDPGIRFRKEISRMVDKGLLMVDERGMRLSQRGLLLGNEVFRAFV